MSQVSFPILNMPASASSRRERILAEMDQVVPWAGLVALIEPYYDTRFGSSSASSAT